MKKQYKFTLRNETKKTLTPKQKNIYYFCLYIKHKTTQQNES